MGAAGWRTWRVAMDEALYDETGGFYRGAGTPRRHFRTAAHASTQWATAILALARRLEQALGAPAAFTIVDLGAGGGELLTGLADMAPGGWRLVGVDRAPRPDGLPARVQWTDALPARVTGLLVAIEWLDVVPLDVAVRADDGLRLVEVAPDGSERAAGPLPAPAEEWAQRWWPTADPGDRCEIGLTRDSAWADAAGRVEPGLALAVDYAAVPSRDAGGTLTGYRSGRQVLPVPDGSMDLTAHVLFESMAAATPPGDEVRLVPQREALRELGMDARRPPYDGDPASYLAALGAAGEAAELLDPGGLGAFTWLVQTRGLQPRPPSEASGPLPI